MTSTTEHLDALRAALRTFESGGAPRLATWGAELARRLGAGGRLLTVGNGGSAAHAEHLASELVGRFRCDRPPYSALALHVDGSTLTALTNDYGPEEMFARQVRAHGRVGDVLVAFSTSGTSRNVLAGAHAANELGLTVWSLTGSAPNPLAALSTEVIAVDAQTTATVQEVHQVALHLLCAAFDDSIEVRGRPARVRRHRGGEEGEGVMPPRAWSAKRERQYEHIKEQRADRGDPEERAEEIAARTVNKARARAGEARQASPISTEDISSGRRGGLRSQRGPGGRTRDQLYEEARRRGIKGRSKMSKDELKDAVAR